MFSRAVSIFSSTTPIFSSRVAWYSRAADSSSFRVASFSSSWAFSWASSSCLVWTSSMVTAEACSGTASSRDSSKAVPRTKDLGRLFLMVRFLPCV